MSMKTYGRRSIGSASCSEFLPFYFVWQFANKKLESAKGIITPC